MNPILTTAFKAARKAGQMMLRANSQLDTVKIDSKAFNDFVSDVDRQSEALLVDTLLYSYPDHIVRSEEGGYFTARKSRDGLEIRQLDAAEVPAVPEYEWIIDPLDGTTNYLHGHKQYAISMALMHRGTLTEALVFAPEHNDLYTASRGQGALLNDKRIRVSSRIELPRCLIATGFPVVDQSMMDRYLAILKDMLAKTAGARREGSAALDLCNVACGRVDGFFEFNLKPWDIAAGALIAKEAGAIVTDMRGENDWLASGDIVAANPKVLAQMLQIIAPHLS
ncbi:myo-inositol-1(or 4)-monophosphatase [Neisseria sp. HSC-16F19]|nr:inositol monophosphatase family protein [Neisseria sp. HSC-16F19]MCP2041705.1 myo-inositol-1(or 4)-monophosphatase [Neisseria sp. HSC-16F19]